MRKTTLVIFAVLVFFYPLVSSADDPNLAPGDQFIVARQALMAAHWKPVVSHALSEPVGIENHLIKNHIREFDVCSVDGEGYCIFRYQRGKQCLTVFTAGEQLKSMRITAWDTKCAEGCFSYRGGKVTGTLVSETFPGRPNYESIEAGDEKETYFFLSLSEPICILEGRGAKELEPAINNISSIQLVLTGKSTYDSLRPSIGQQVTCEGSFYSAHTAHHKTPALMWKASCH